ncbi:MOSC domain-containing protein [Aliiglaciecola litoralis]|uniref:MOSC domain-containing protein n=1 Tax=Aliiglaciecola litoralis TaxID=582857 RepID=A0ABN1LCD2_9ALTE
MKLVGIAIRERNQAPMKTREEAIVTLSEGVVGDFKRRPGKRQVTVLSLQQWQHACAELETTLPWTTRRANLLVNDIEFTAQMVGKTLKIGDLELLITAETEPCHKMDQQCQGLRAALTPDWRGGVCCKVIAGGEIRLGDALTLI